VKHFRKNGITDFYCPKTRLLIEIDGGQHYGAEGKEKDRLRDEYMAQAGTRVLRFSDREVLENLESVFEKLWSGL
jgi:very-short-patch-repair endonuclease